METQTLATLHGDFLLVEANKLRGSLDVIPAEPGVYIWLVKSGSRLLEMSSYFDTDDRHPVNFGGYSHLYTGSGYDLRFRLTQHVRSEKTENSSPRKSLLALEHMFAAVTEVYGTRYGDLKNGGLTEWIFDNVIFGYEVNYRPLDREATLIGLMASPFNIAHRRRHKYSKYLMAWRAIAFPSGWMETIPLQSRANPVDAATLLNRRAMLSAVSVK